MQQCIIIFLGCFLISGVLAGQSQQENPYNEKFDPMKLKEPREEFLQEETRQNIQRQLANDSVDVIHDQPAENQQTGYRVQLAATPNYQEADSLYQYITDLFQETAASYLIYDSPNYKVRIGNCTTRDEAELLQGIAQEHGFRYAWIVRSSVVQDRIPTQGSSPAAE